MLYFDKVLWSEGHAYLDKHTGNYIVAGSRDDDTGMAPDEQVLRLTTMHPEACSLQISGTVHEIGSECGFPRGHILPPEHAGETSIVTIRWDVYQTGLFIMNLLSRGSWDFASFDPGQFGGPLADLATLAVKWSSDDPRGPSVGGLELTGPRAPRL